MNTYQKNNMINNFNEEEIKIFSALANHPDLMSAVLNNNIENFSILTKGKHMIVLNDALCVASKHGSIDIIKLLLKNDKVIADDFENYPICLAYANGYFDIVDLLFDINEVNELFKKYNLNEYNEFSTMRIKNKISEF